MILHVDHFADRRNVCDHFGRDLRHRIAAMLADQEQSDRTRLFEHILQLARLVAGVDRHQHDPGHRQREFGDHPFGNVGCPHRNPLARPVAREQGQGEALAVGEQFAVGPLAAKLPIRIRFVERGRIGGLRGGDTQDVADGPILQRLIGLGRAIGLGQGQGIHRASGRRSSQRATRTALDPTSARKRKGENARSRRCQRARGATANPISLAFARSCD